MPDGSTLLTGGAPAAPVETPAPVVAPAAPAAPVPPARFALPDDLKTHDTFRKFMGEDGLVDAHVLAKSYVNAESMIGRDKVPLPKTDEDWDNWYKAAGRPEAPEKYELARPEKLPEGFYSEDDEKTFRQWAHANGLNQKQAAAFYNDYLKVQVERINAHHERMKGAAAEAEATLRREVGAQYDAHRNLAVTTFKQYADADFTAYVEESGLGNDPRFIRVFSKIGKDMMGDGQLKGAPETAPMSVADLDKRIAEFRSSNKDALMNQRHPDHRRLTEDYRKMLDDRYQSQ